MTSCFLICLQSSHHSLDSSLQLSSTSVHSSLIKEETSNFSFPALPHRLTVRSRLVSFPLLGWPLPTSCKLLIRTLIKVRVLSILSWSIIHLLDPEKEGVSSLRWIFPPQMAPHALCRMFIGCRHTPMYWTGKSNLTLLTSSDPVEMVDYSIRINSNPHISPLQFKLLPHSLQVIRQLEVSE